MNSTVHVPTNDAVLVFTDSLSIKGVGVKIGVLIPLVDMIENSECVLQCIWIV